MSKNYAAKDSGSRKKFTPKSNLTTTNINDTPATSNTQSQAADRRLQCKIDDDQDGKFGYGRYTEGQTRTAYMYNMFPTHVYDDGGIEYSAMDMYMVQHDGQTFKATYVYNPYFLIQVNGQSTTVNECESFLMRQFGENIVRIEHLTKHNLALNNHLTGIQQLYLKLYFNNEDSMKSVRRQLLPIIEQNRIEQNKSDTQANHTAVSHQQRRRRDEVLTRVVDIREYDVPYDQRVNIDLGFRSGLWYDVTPVPGQQSCDIKRRPDILDKPSLKVCAWDIETSKEPLKFPDANNDPIIMISYMMDTQGYLLVNRSIVSQDIDSFEYNPKPGEYDGPFDVVNCPTEKDMLQYFFKHIRDEHVHIMTTYNGDYFDFPYVEQRASKYNLSMRTEIGMWRKPGIGKGKAANKQENEYIGRFTVHLDCKHWVDRDSYLPQGSRGLKAVTKAKLKYEPVEMDYEDIVPWSIERPQELATYSVSDAVATYYLYDTYVHNFIFSLCTIIPSNPNDVLRFGSGTLCELLLMVQAYESNIVCPNKQAAEHTQFYKGHLLDSETYIGGFVEACEAGIFRSDLPTDFYCNPVRVQSMIDDIDNVLQFVLTVELNSSVDQLSNYADIKQQVIDQLTALLHKPRQHVMPMIYHLDVGAMYPNIILTNRLQPMAIVNETVCASCDYNRPGNNCQRAMPWKWRGRYLPATRSEYELIKQQIEVETTTAVDDTTGLTKAFHQLSVKQQAEIVKKRVKQYGQTVYKKQVIESEEDRNSTICQRENSFYVDTVRAFRDRRYDYKALSKKAKQQLDGAQTELDIAKAKDLCLLYDSLQLAHKCILNSFYGYVMRKGARWYSMDMAGIVTLTGAQLIQDATAIVRDIGRPLELDTDGIWCILPSSFPDTFAFNTTGGKSLKFNYACALLNHMVHTKYTNAQYQTLKRDEVTGKTEYVSEPQCSIFFELDGPYRAMVLPSGLEDGQMIKKRYAVFNDDGSIAELKGFELKRRGELQIIKTLQEDIFKNGSYLEGMSLVDAYAAVGRRANHWLDLLHNRGNDLEDSDLFQQIGESKNLSDEIASYGDKKLVSITALKRLGEFLGESSISGKNLSIKYVIVKYPAETDVSQRAVPIKIFDASEVTKRLYLRKWTKQNHLTSYDVRDLLDWNYYIDRLNKAIQKIITIPAAFQHIENPVPRTAHPDWLQKKLNERNSLHQQQKLSAYFTKAPERVKVTAVDDIESMGGNRLHAGKLPYQPVKQLMIEETKEMEVEIVQHAATIIPVQSVDPLSLVSANPNVNATGWAAQQKQLWQQLRKNQKQTARDTVTDFGGFALGNRAAVKVAKKDETVLHIVSIEPNVKAGSNMYHLYAVFAGNGNMIHKLTFKQNRTFYLNCYNDNVVTSQPYFSHKRITTKVLPYNKPVRELYECTLHDDYVNFDLNQFVAKHYSDIENVYGNNIDTVHQFMLEYGNTVKLTNKNILNYGKHVYTAADFRAIDYGNDKYLQQMSTGVKQFNIIYIYELVYKGRGVLCAYIDATQQCHIYALNHTDADANAEQTIFAADFAAQHPQYDSIQFNITNTKSRATIIKDMRAAIGEHMSETTIVVMDVDRLKRQTLMSEMTILSGVPKVYIDHSKQLHVKPADTFANIRWYDACIRQLYKSLTSYTSQLTDQLALCRFARIPLCQCTSSDNDMHDIVFGRTLLDNNYVLWNSRLDTIVDVNYFGNALSLSIKPCQPALYRCICMEFNLENILINAIENYQLFYEIYHKTAVNDTTTTMLRLFKQFVHQYVMQTVEKQCNISEALLKNVYAWYKNNTMFYDATLCSKIVELVSMCLNQLTAQFEKLGSTVVYVSMTKLIVSTNRYAENHCFAYIKTILSSIQSKDRFYWCSLTPNLMFHNLLFVDTANFGGVLVQGQLDSSAGDSDSSSEIVANWNMAEYLPTHAEQFFLLTVSEYLLKPNTYFQNDVLGIKAEKPVRPDEQVEKLTEYINEEVQTYFTRVLMERVRQLQIEYPSNERAAGQSDLFPVLAGSHLPLHNAALEFVKMVCYCMSLDALGTDSVHRMRESLMKLVQVKSFSAQAAYHQPCLTYVLTDITCANCGVSTDLDICRDPNLTGAVKQMTDGNDVEWQCDACQHPYSVGDIELQLQSIVCAATEKFQVQDLRCTSCSRVRDNQLQQFCACSGTYVNTVSGDEYKKMLHTFGNIANYYTLHRLQDTIAWLQTH